MTYVVSNDFRDGPDPQNAESSVAEAFLALHGRCHVVVEEVEQKLHFYVGPKKTSKSVDRPTSCEASFKGRKFMRFESTFRMTITR